MNTPVGEPESFSGAFARVGQRFPCHFEKQSLLRIHPLRFSRRDFEELRIELVDTIEETAPAGVHLAGSLTVGIKVEAGIPSIGRHFADCIDTVGQQIPKRLRVFRARETATDSHDRDRLSVGDGPGVRLDRRSDERVSREMGGKGLDGRVFPRQRRGYSSLEPPFQLAGDFHR
jgi:hypothetical protein